MKLPLLHITRCFTGRRWINIGRGAFAVGFGPRRFIERVWFGRRLVWWTR
jgi:hypothetical protein